jgi:hypothetical protein
MTATYPLIDEQHLHPGEAIAGPVEVAWLAEEMHAEGIIQAAHLTNGATIHFDGEFVGVYRREAAEAFGMSLLAMDARQPQLGPAPLPSTALAQDELAGFSAERKAA